MLLRPSPFWRSLALVVCALALLLPLSGCGGGGHTVTIPITAATPPVGTGLLVAQPGWTVNFPTRTLAPRKWTVLVYLNAANNLEPFGTQNVNQMEQVGSTNDVNVVVQWKRLGGTFDPAGGSWTDTRRYYITHDVETGKVNSPLISQNGSVDMGKPQSLQEFVQWGVAAFPAEHYCLVLWNHGAGWRAATRSALTSPTRGISYDTATGSHIETIEIPGAIDISSAGLKWDLVAMDASLMQMAEVTYEMRAKTRFLVGSEESPPGAGYPYDTILADLTGAPTEDGRALGQQFAQDMLDRYGPNADTTQSVLDMSQLDSVRSSIDQLGSALLAAEPAWGTQIATARSQSEFYGHGDSLYTAYKDLTDYLDELTQTHSTGSPFVNDPGVLTAVASVRNALGNAILFNVHGSQHPNSHGLSLYIPSPSQYQSVELDQASGFGQPYPSLSFAKDAPNWASFLKNGTF